MRFLLLTCLVILMTASPTLTQSPINVMILTGQCNQYHNWRVSSVAVKRMLEDSGRFKVTVVTSPATGENMAAFLPTFAPRSKAR